jgi:hypothetical protein
MAMYISIDVDEHRHLMGRKTQITLTDRQHAFLRHEAARTGLPMTELIRRAVDATYRPYSRLRVRGFELSLGVWRRPDEGLVGRRLRRREPRPG